jgi:hypothetical protein
LSSPLVYLVVTTTSQLHFGFTIFLCAWRNLALTRDSCTLPTFCSAMNFKMILLEPRSEAEGRLVSIIVEGVAALRAWPARLTRRCLAFGCFFLRRRRRRRRALDYVGIHCCCNNGRRRHPRAWGLRRGHHRFWRRLVGGQSRIGDHSGLQQPIQAGGEAGANADIQSKCDGECARQPGIRCV